MLEITRSATFTDHKPDEALTTIVARSVLEAALTEDEPGRLWFEVEGDDESRMLAVDLSVSDLEELLRLSGSDDVALSLDAQDVESLFDDPEVEGHGMKGVIAIAVTSSAVPRSRRRVIDLPPPRAARRPPRPGVSPGDRPAVLDRGPRPRP